MNSKRPRGTPAPLKKTSSHSALLHEDTIPTTILSAECIILLFIFDILALYRYRSFLRKKETTSEYLWALVYIQLSQVPYTMEGMAFLNLNELK